MVRARSSPRHRLFRHIATARPSGSAASRRRVVSRPETRHRRVPGSIASVTASPRSRRARLVPRRAASRPASTHLPATRSHPSSRVSRSHRRRTTPSSPRRSRRSTRSARICLSSSRTTSSSSGTSAWARAGSAQPTEPSGEVRTRETPADGFDTRSAREKTHTESHTRVSNVPSPLTKNPPNVFRFAFFSTGEEVCARVVDTTRVSCAVEEVATVDGTRAEAIAKRVSRTRARRTTTRRRPRVETKSGFGPPLASDAPRRAFISPVFSSVEKKREKRFSRFSAPPNNRRDAFCLTLFPTRLLFFPRMTFSCVQACPRSPCARTGSPARFARLPTIPI